MSIIEKTRIRTVRNRKFKQPKKVMTSKELKPVAIKRMNSKSDKKQRRLKIRSR